MICPVDRGGCGKNLEWDDGAFCKECMAKAFAEEHGLEFIERTTTPKEDEDGQ